MLKLLYLMNLIRSIPAYIIVKMFGDISSLKQDTENFKWYVNADAGDSFFDVFNKLTLRNPCYRNIVAFRTSRNKVSNYFVRFLLPQKKDLEIYGKIGGGLIVFHGHGTIVTAESIGKNFGIYQGVTIGKNVRAGNDRTQPIIGDNVTVYANAIVAGGICIGDNVSIGAGTVVMKDIPSNSIVYGNPCIVRPKQVN